MKALKLFLDVPIKSYFLKKVLLRKEFKAKLNCNYQDEIRAMSTLLFEIMSFPEIKMHFENKIDFDTWKSFLDGFGRDGQIPIHYDKVPNKRILSVKCVKKSFHCQKIKILCSK